MYESLALSLLSAISSFLFSSEPTNSETITIEGAPIWYGKNEKSSYITAYGYNKGDINYLILTKENCEKNINLTLTKLIEQSSSKSFENQHSPYYKEFIETYKKEHNLEGFISKTISYDKLHYKQTTQESFSKCTIPKITFLKYEEQILKDIGKSYSKYKLHRNMDDLDKEVEKL